MDSSEEGNKVTIENIIERIQGVANEVREDHITLSKLSDSIYGSQGEIDPQDEKLSNNTLNNNLITLEREVNSLHKEIHRLIG